MTKKYQWCAVLAATCLLPISALAQEGAMEGEEMILPEVFEEKIPEVPWSTQAELEYTSQVEAGVGYTSEDSFKFGEYNGLEDEGPYGIGNLDLRMQEPFDKEDSAYYARMRGYNLGLDSRFVEIEAGNQGKYSGYVGYDQIPKNLIDSARTPFIGAGDTNLTLPSDWDPGTTTRGMDNLILKLRDVEIDHDRKRLQAGFSVIPAPHWEFRGDYQREWKDGTRTIGAVIGNTGGNPRAAIVPEPTDYLTDQLTVTLAYTEERYQAELSYYLSLFDNEHTSLTWQNPFETISGWADGVGFPTGRGRLGLPPDNEFHQINFSGGYNVTPTTRVTLDAGYGWMLQNDTFLPYTVNDFLAVSVPLPRNSLDGEINTTLVDLRLDSRPTPKLHLRGGYRFDDRDNNTPQAQFIYIGGDSQDQDAAEDSERRRTNLPYSYTSHDVTADAAYEVYTRTEASVGYEFELVKRDFQEVEETWEHIAKAGIRSAPNQYVSLRGDVSYGIKEGDEYVFNAPFHLGFAPAVVEEEEELGLDWENLPQLRKFYEADRNRLRVVGQVTVMPMDRLSISLHAGATKDVFDDSAFGLRERRLNDYSADVSYAPTDDVTTYAFYTFEDIESDQAGRSFSGSAKAEQSVDPTRNWFVDIDDEIDTAGVGAEWKNVIKNRLDLGVEYVYSRSESGYEFRSGSSLSGAPIPSLETTLHSVGVFGTYHFRKDLALNVGYRFESYETFDFALDGVAPNELANVITLGDISPDYDVHVVAASVSYRF